MRELIINVGIFFACCVVAFVLVTLHAICQATLDVAKEIRELRGDINRRSKP